MEEEKLEKEGEEEKEEEDEKMKDFEMLHDGLNELGVIEEVIDFLKKMKPNRTLKLKQGKLGWMVIVEKEVED